MFKKLVIGILGLSGYATTTMAATPPVASEAAIEASILASANFMNMDRLLPVDTDATDSDTEILRLVADLLNEANLHIGTRYVRGGKSPKGFDCSGFTSYVYRQFGYRLSPSSRGQYTDGIEISTDEVKPGDLLFFKGRRSRSVGHVAIAIDADPETGDITFIHAAVKGGIRVDRVSMPYYSQRFLGARRVIN